MNAIDQSRVVRAKFKCHSITKEGDTNRITFSAVTEGCRENDIFFKHTPAGTLDLFVVSHGTAERFESGKDYYLDFTPAD